MAFQHHVGKWYDSEWLFLLLFNHRNDTSKLFLQATPPVPKQAWKMDELAWTVSHTAMKKLLPSAASSAWSTLVFFGPQVANPTSLQNSFTNFNLDYTHAKTNEWQWKINHEWRCISYWKWGCSIVTLVFGGVAVAEQILLNGISGIVAKQPTQNTLPQLCISAQLLHSFWRLKDGK